MTDWGRTLQSIWAIRSKENFVEMFLFFPLLFSEKINMLQQLCKCHLQYKRREVMLLSVARLFLARISEERNIWKGWVWFSDALFAVLHFVRSYRLIFSRSCFVRINVSNWLWLLCATNNRLGVYISSFFPQNFVMGGGLCLATSVVGSGVATVLATTKQLPIFAFLKRILACHLLNTYMGKRRRSFVNLLLSTLIAGRW